ncbi:MAG: tetratricopeptide repeat protein [Candidatus Omnitrophica bacterium]|nr:tetratricopeptide repeat protein [Candidatus Omnitrophota bacterium]
MYLKIKYASFSLITLVLFLGLVEGVCRIFFVYPGASDFVERRIIEQGLTKDKSSGEFRVILYGESTMQGDALSPKSTIEKWITTYLEDLLGKDTAKRVKVYNLARIGSNSQFIAKSFADTVPYKPDLAVFYVAHNDFVQLDNRHPRRMSFGQKGFLKHYGRRLVKQSAFLSELTRLHIRFKIRHHLRDDKFKKVTPPVIETWEKFYNPQYDAIVHDSLLFETLFGNWVGNINKIVRVAERHRIPVIFLEGVSNLKEYAPNESVHSPSLDPFKLSQWEVDDSRATRAFAAKKYKEARAFYQRCLRIDPEYALTHYRLGQCYENLSRFEKARKSYSMANDKDRVPLRAPSEVNQFYDDLEKANFKDITVIKTAEIFEKFSPNGLIDSCLVLDTMHPTIEGQALIALEIVKVIYDKGLVSPKESWHWNELGPTNEYIDKLGLDKDFQFSVYLNKAIFVGRFYDKAIEYSQKALLIRPDSIEAKRALAWTYWRKGEKEKAIDLYEELYEKSPEVIAEVFKKYPDLGNVVLVSRRRAGRRIPLQSLQPV